MKTRIALTEFIDEILYRTVIEHRHISDAVDMPDSWYRTIRYLSKNKSSTMKDVATFLQVSTPRATIIGEELVRAGYAKRNICSDRRKIQLELTKRGKDIIESTTKLHQHMSEHILAKLTAEEREQFYLLLQKCLPEARNTVIETEIEHCILLNEKNT